MYLIVVFLPFLSFLITIVCGRLFGSKGVCYITIILMFITMFISYIIFYEVGLLGSFCNIQLFKWIDSELVNLYWGFYFDSITAIMLIVVNTISFCVHLYSMNYMLSDPHLSRFMSYLSLFTFFMLILITGDNFVQMFVGWEGVGLASYLLISFWYTRIQANKSAMKAMIVNRIGDFGLILGIVVIFSIFKTFDFQVIFSLVPFYESCEIIFFNKSFFVLDLICILLLIGAIGKSAQIGLHVWLPDAMEGPTPVSALIHAATMVTAGVFVLLRCSLLLEHTNNVLSIITIFGALTAFFAATVGVFQNDLKKVIAYSTCSQLGYMVFSCGLSNYSVSLFHLMNHAFFKAMLFLGAGAVIHSMFDEQDMRRMGALLHSLRFGYIAIFIGSLALMGFPFLAGFYSKDVILELAYSKYTVYGSFSYWLGIFSAFLTAYYSIRLISLTFYIDAIGLQKWNYHKILDCGWGLMVPLSILFIGSIFIGFLMRDMMVGFGSSFWQESLYINILNNTIIDAEFLPLNIKLLPLIFSLSGALLSFFFYCCIYDRYNIFMFYKFDYIKFKNSKFVNIYQLVYRFFNQKWYFDRIYYEFFIKPLMFLGYHVTFKMIDRGFVELLGPLGIIRSFLKCSQFISKLQSGMLYHYVLFIVLGFILLVLYINFSVIIVDTRIYFLLIFIPIYWFYIINKEN